MNLEMCNECLEYGTLNEYGVCDKCQLKDVEELIIAEEYGK